MPDGRRHLLSELGRNPWWRWIYLFGGRYVLFDLPAHCRRPVLWHSLLAWMFDVTSPAGIFLWGFSVLLGGASAALGLASGAPHIGNGPVPYGTSPFLFRVQNQPPSRLSCNSSAPHSSSAASPLVRGALRPPSSDSTPQVARLAADWAAQVGIPSSASVSADVSHLKGPVRSTAASAAVMGSSAWNTTCPSLERLPAPVLPSARRRHRALAQVGIDIVGKAGALYVLQGFHTGGVHGLTATNSPRVTAASGWKK